ncbi:MULTISPECIES: hypothetical protein [unclassified Brevundimonas]|uniref:hypothetical protein n=1 Tax=unclassified Brevundimonas TaxID=2622653 RepID=UPI0025BB54F8|nr:MULTISPECIES: hypothetical protein [unclassified Brevundimonas]
MSAFEFFFSFYGLVLGLSVSVIATGVARAFKHRKTVKVGWKTPVLAAFVALDIATFWDAAWTNFSTAPYSYGLLIAGLVVATVYFVATSLIFPEPDDEVQDLDAHFWANKRAIMLLLVLANLMMMSGSIWMSLPKTHGALIAGSYAFNMAIYLVLVIPAALTRRAWVFALTVGLHIALYLFLAGLSILNPARMAAAAAGAS